MRIWWAVEGGRCGPVRDGLEEGEESSGAEPVSQVTGSFLNA